MSPDPDFVWLEEIIMGAHADDEVVQVGGVAVVVRRRDGAGEVAARAARREALQAYKDALHATRDPARDRTRGLQLDTEEEIEAAAVRIRRSP